MTPKNSKARAIRQERRLTPFLPRRRRILWKKTQTITKRLEVLKMSNRDIAKTLIDQIPETRLFNVILFLQGAALPDAETPNAETAAAIAELANGGGTRFSGDTSALFASILEG